MISDEEQLEREVLALLEQAHAFPAQEQEQFIRQQTENHPDLQKRVLSILAAKSKVGARLLTSGAAKLIQDFDTPETIGPYSVIERLGAGGMGTVFLGVRGGEDFEHKVALKLVQHMGQSPELLARFRAERRVLAKLKHSNIAQMYDGGDMEDGIPYLAMEYIDGQTLEDFLDKSHPHLNRRLELFDQICAGVSYAHSKLVIHRDLSPSNVLVTHEGSIKIIDFGISHDLNDDDLQSKFEHSPQTIGFSAPERGDGVAASTALDVYSLGAMLRYLCEGLSLPRGSDLAAIVEKACAEDPENRYTSAESLRADTLAYLAGHTVKARGGGALYRVRCLVARKPLSFIAGVASAMTIVATSVVMSALYVQADAAEKRAEARFDDVRELANYFIFDLDKELARLDGATPVREKNFQQAVEYLDALQSDPSASKALKLELAIGYKRLADVAGNAGFANLGDRQDASELLAVTRKLLEDLKISNPDLPELQSAELELVLAEGIHVAISNGDHKTALAYFETAEILAGKINSPYSNDRLNHARAATSRAYSLMQIAEYGSAIEWGKTARDRYIELRSSTTKQIDFVLGLARANTNLGEAQAWYAYESGGDYSASLANFEKAVTGLEDYLEMHEDLPEVRRLLSIALLKRANTTCYIDGMRMSGFSDLEKARQISMDLADKDPKNAHHPEQLTNIYLQSADCHFQVGQFDQALTSIEQVIALRSELLSTQPANASYHYQLIGAYGTQRWIQEGAGLQAAACETATTVYSEWERYDLHHVDITNPQMQELRTQNDQFLENCT